MREVYRPGSESKTDAGDTSAGLSLIHISEPTFTSHGIRTSIFVGTDLENIELAAKTGTDRIELYTEPYATLYPVNREEAIAPFLSAAGLAKNLGLGVNAGHDLSLENLAYFHQNIPGLDEVSIGHALISDALYYGLKETIRLYKECLVY